MEYSSRSGAYIYFHLRSVPVPLSIFGVDQLFLGAGVRFSVPPNDSRIQSSIFGANQLFLGAKSINLGAQINTSLK